MAWLIMGQEKMKNKANLLRPKTSDARLQTWNLKNKANPVSPWHRHGFKKLFEKNII
jgi:hypothetical protein